MKKLSFFWILALVICSVISCAEKEQFEQELQTQKREQFKEKLSHEVTQTEARESLEKILTKLNIPSTRGGDTKLPPITSVYTTGKAAEMTRAGEAVEPYFHIFNFGDEEGFAIMSGDDRVEPLLALTFKGELTPETEIENPGFQIAYEKMEEYYVQQVSSRIIEGPSITIPPKDSLPDPVFTFDSVVYNMPLGHCPVEWGQGDPYYRYCSTLDGQQAYTGCAAVAVGQLMAIYKYPNSYRYLPTSVPEIFDWEDMTSDDRSPDGTDKIAILMYQLGRSNNLCMIYEPVTDDDESTWSTPETVPRTLRNFGYANGGQLIDYDEDRVVSELADGYPVLLRGEKGSVGHIWLGDGLKEYTTTSSYYHLSQGWITTVTTFYYVHCNWGWYGEYNGYFLSGVFNVRGTATNNIQAYINIRKQ